MTTPLNLAQIRLHIRDGWQEVTNEQHNGKWMDVMLADGTVIRAHWAQNTSGEEQPPYRGWFKRVGNYMAQIDDPILWKPAA